MHCAMFFWRLIFHQLCEVVVRFSAFDVLFELVWQSLNLFHGNVILLIFVKTKIRIDLA